ncbi:hypothetical protein TREMEDRAFT_62132 [Tremella mesenterica DSM 1558]|uniref:uncharacterized protein n=1 Tax=Tremella mesenterica (strain ATCC 24925 / CBS 8224 / DSM 1558 / NBRC 9311 / NRRL Y-6157 / RJB 2259-6 / UBC 559-6) TaxID=578456 RepID=UPI0003F4A4E5|nr:uncharacterized protein TREMEDRAFT_62132 [Tremella mesenterica DSM 1558]EIW69275.1 hypothetical protein TREMEDRAFT_62132 [Tremella mesenterica DSM 1558]
MSKKWVIASPKITEALLNADEERVVGVTSNLGWDADETSIVLFTQWYLGLPEEMKTSERAVMGAACTELLKWTRKEMGMVTETRLKTVKDGTGFDIVAIAKNFRHPMKPHTLRLLSDVTTNEVTITLQSRFNNDEHIQNKQFDSIVVSFLPLDESKIKLAIAYQQDRSHSKHNLNTSIHYLSTLAPDVTIEAVRKILIRVNAKSSMPLPNAGLPLIVQDRRAQNLKETLKGPHSVHANDTKVNHSTKINESTKADEVSQVRHGSKGLKQHQ